MCPSGNFGHMQRSACPFHGFGGIVLLEDIYNVRTLKIGKSPPLLSFRYLYNDGLQVWQQGNINLIVSSNYTNLVDVLTFVLLKYHRDSYNRLQRLLRSCCHCQRIPSPDHNWI